VGEEEHKRIMYLKGLKCKKEENSTPWSSRASQKIKRISFARLIYPSGVEPRGGNTGGYSHNPWRNRGRGSKAIKAVGDESCRKNSAVVLV